MALLANFYNIEGEKLGEIELPETVFGIKPNPAVVWEVVRAYQANQRQGTASTKTRGEVRGGGRKPWRQKHTGRARVGSIRSPIWVGGGVVFGPKPRSYYIRVPKKVKRLAIKSVLSERAKQGRIIVLEDFDMEKPRTKKIAEFLKGVDLLDKKTLLVLATHNENIYKSGRNIRKLGVREARLVNVYDVLVSRHLVITKDALRVMEEVWGK